MRIILYNDAEQNERATVEMNLIERSSLFQLKGFLEGVDAPREMTEAYYDLLNLATGDGFPVGKARIR